MKEPRLLRIELHPFLALSCLLLWYYLVRAAPIARWRLPDPFRDTALWGIHGNAQPCLTIETAFYS